MGVLKAARNLKDAARGARSLIFDEIDERVDEILTKFGVSLVQSALRRAHNAAKKRQELVAVRRAFGQRHMIGRHRPADKMRVFDQINRPAGVRLVSRLEQLRHSEENVAEQLQVGRRLRDADCWRAPTFV